MKIDVYSNMYNEEKMLPYWLRHYETVADRIFIWDGGSTDKTLAILKKHKKVTLLPRDNHKHDDVYYRDCLYPQYMTYSRGVSDWVMIADADEFIYHPQLLKVLQKSKEQGIKIIQCAGFTMISDEFPKKSGQIYEEIKMGIPSYFDTKWTIHSPDIKVRFLLGRHGRPVVGLRYPNSRDTGIKLLHFRFLGRKYTESRDRRNYESIALVNPVFKDAYSPDMYSKCPDRSCNNIFKWLELHKKEAVNVIDT